MDEKKKGVYKELIRTDKHGNKTYRTNACKRCGGYGRIYFSDLDDGRCWSCGGCGLTDEYKTIEYTPEQLQIREEKKILKRVGSVESQLKWMGFDTEKRIAFRCLGNTFPIKDRIKAMGGKWTKIGWVMPVKPDFCECQELTQDDVIIETFGEYFPRQVVRWADHFYANMEG